MKLSATEADNLARVADREREKPIQRFTVREWWKYAAVLVAVCLFATNLFYITKEEPEAYNTVVVPKGQRVSLLLSDGTTVWLNAESRFSYPAKFSEKYRTVTLEGEAILRWHIIPNVRLR